MTTPLLISLDHQIAPMGGPMSGFELMYAILAALERLADATERVAHVQKLMLEAMQAPESNTANVSTEYL